LRGGNCEEGMIMEERERLIQQLDRARQAMRAALAGIDTEREIYANWSVKHLLAHITGWDQVATATLRAHASGEEPGEPTLQDINAVNDEFVASREALDYKQVAEEWKRVRQELETVIQEMPEDRFQVSMLFPWGEHGTVSQIVNIFSEHEEEHAVEIRKIRAE
jgi:hypothetical protein